MQFVDVLAKVRDFCWIKIVVYWDDSDEYNVFTYVLGTLCIDDVEVDAEEIFYGVEFYDYSLEYNNGQPVLKLWASKDDMGEDDGEY